MNTILDVAANESGSNKLQASKNCALSLVRQLYHLKILEAFTGQKKKKIGDEVGLIVQLVIMWHFVVLLYFVVILFIILWMIMFWQVPTFNIGVEPVLETQIKGYLEANNITPVHPVKMPMLMVLYFINDVLH